MPIRTHSPRVQIFYEKCSRSDFMSEVKKNGFKVRFDKSNVGKWNEFRSFVAVSECGSETEFWMEMKGDKVNWRNVWNSFDEKFPECEFGQWA